MVISKKDDLIVVKIFMGELDGVDIYDRDSLVSLFKGIVERLNKKYDLCGMVDIDVYINDDYGMIMEVDNIYKYDGEVDIKIKFNIDSVFMYEVNDISDIEGNVYYYCDKYYTDCLDRYFDSSVIYSNCLDIIQNGIKVK